MAIPDQMIQLDTLTDQDGVELPVYRDYDHLIIGRIRLDLDDIARLAALIDEGVGEIRRYRDRQAVDGG